MGRGLGKTQKRILEILKSEEFKWVSLNVIIIKRYHPEQLDKEKARERGYWDWSYSERERKVVWRSVKALRRRKLVNTRLRYIGKGTKGHGCRWLEVSLPNR